jgi:adenylate cyclase
MESLGVPGRIHVSPALRDRLVDRFVFESRGVMEVKGKGPTQTYFLVGRRSAAADAAEAAPDAAEIPDGVRARA